MAASKKLQLSIGMASNPRTWPIFDGLVQPEGIDLIANEVFPSELFWRQLKFADFDVAEMSMSSLMMSIAGGDERWVGLPVFTTHHFFQTWALIRKDAGIERPQDLKGKRVGVPEYQQTAALWTRGILQHEFGVAPQDMEFWMERTPEHSHAGATGFKPPKGVTIHQIPPEKSIGSMMLSGELHATLLYVVNRNLIDRSKADLGNHPNIRGLFPDADAEGTRYFAKTGIYPINHGMVIKRELAERHPWIVLNLLTAFERAREIVDHRRLAHAEDHLSTGAIPASARAALAKPVLKHGIVANRKILETAAQYSNEQGLTPRVLKLEEIFAKSTLNQ